ncbi:MAG: sulfotransferase [Acidimicrobiia bacterium]|nr:sulfotransferase [Acidimicrobiia bacterium]
MLRERESRATVVGAPPIVIIGAARSGTKFLRDVLAASEAVHAIPYDVNMIWRLGNERSDSDAYGPDSLSSRECSRIRRYLEKAGRMRDDGTGRLLEKSVSNTLRVGLVDRVLPDAQFVHLVRDGRAVAESARRQWESSSEPGYLARKVRSLPVFPTVRYAASQLLERVTGRGVGTPWGPRYPGVVQDMAHKSTLEVCAIQWRECIGRARADLDGLGPARVREVRYEALVADETALGSLTEWLGIPDPERVRSRFRRDVETDGLDRWKRALTPDEHVVLDILLGSMLRELGYA